MERRFPIGRYAKQTSPPDRAARAEFIEAVAQAPAAIRKLVDGLSAADLNRRYREGGWTIRQVVHHVPDSHMHAYVRFKFALTEADPAVRAYNEVLWAELPDVGRVAPMVSVDLLDALHQRWVSTLRAMSDEEFLRTYLHSELGPVPLYDALGLYAWHGRHHAAHIALALS
jgi:hypothetical protein